MRQYDSSNLVVHPQADQGSELIVEVTPEKAGWDTIHFQARRLSPGRSWSFATGQHELALVVLGGRLNIRSNHGEWMGIGERPDVFSGLPYAVYLPTGTEFSVEAETDAEFAAAWVRAEQAFPARLVSPPEVAVEIRGGDHATRHINNIIPPGFPCQRLVVVEVYTPGGNWSSYPPHKHDQHLQDPTGKLAEADLDEVYYYKIDRPEGYALQYVYTDLSSPIHQAGHPIDAPVVARSNDVVLVPEGYHPVSSPPGYTAYYLNVLAGTAQALTARDDPRYAWVKGTYQSQDPRVPIYPLPKENV
jgi:5-deoxy-glucuronate isomerase